MMVWVRGFLFTKGANDTASDLHMYVVSLVHELRVLVPHSATPLGSAIFTFSITSLLVHRLAQNSPQDPSDSRNVMLRRRASSVSPFCNFGNLDFAI